MRYPAVITTEGKFTLAHFPSCPGCQTQADPGEDIAAQATEALEGWLEAHLIAGDAPPRPPKRAPKGRVLWVEVSAVIAAKLTIRWARQDAGLSQAQLAKRVGMAQQMIAKLEHPDYTPGLAVLERVLRALGFRIEFVPARREAHRLLTLMGLVSPVRPAARPGCSSSAAPGRASNGPVTAGALRGVLGPTWLSGFVGVASRSPPGESGTPPPLPEKLDATPPSPAVRLRHLAGCPG